MDKNELQAMVVAELKALAEKMKTVVPARAKKADIIDTLLAANRKKKAAEKKAASMKQAEKAKAAAKPKAAAKTKTAKAPAEKKIAGTGPSENKQAATKPAKQKAAGTKPLPIKAADTKKAAGPAKSVIRKREPVRKHPEAAAKVHEWKTPPAAEEPLLAQERALESKYYTGPDRREAPPSRDEAPKTYGQDRIVLMTRDPFVAHAYWEAGPERLERERSWFGWDSRLTVRIYDITGVQFDGRNATGVFDQEVFERAGNWYFDLGRPGHSFCADLGLLSPEGRFLTLARSNYITMPREGVSDVIDPEWMLEDEEFWKAYGYPEGFRGGLSSPELEEMMRRRRLQEISSPGLFSRERAKTRRK
jgi:hypothetical protein